MRIFVSSSFEDLREHRAAAIRVLRQLGHEVIAMEDMIAGTTVPLAKVVEMVDRAEGYVGIFAWRYGYVPPRPVPAPMAPGVAPPEAGKADGQTSITHHEYLRAVKRQIPVMAFLLDETYPWPPQYIDGFDKTRPDAPASAEKIRALRGALQLERVVSWFTTPADLEARVSAAVTMAGLTRQLDLQPAPALDPWAGIPTSNPSGESGITKAIVQAGDHQRALKIDIATTWWSTRLYLLAALAERLTEVRRILIVEIRPEPTLPSQAPSSPPVKEERFVGQVSTSVVLRTVGPKVPALETFAKSLKERGTGYSHVRTEIDAVLESWRQSFGDEPGKHVKEEAARVDLTAEVLRRWFGDAMLRQPIHIADLQRASVVDLLRLLDYPNDYVPVLIHPPEAALGQAVAKRVDVLDKAALNARLARSYLEELMDRARIA